MSYQLFQAVYRASLTQALRDNPIEYAWPADHIPQIAERMADGLLNGRANKDGEAIRRTCRLLGIKHSYRAIRAFMSQHHSVSLHDTRQALWQGALVYDKIDKRTAICVFSEGNPYLVERDKL